MGLFLRTILYLVVMLLWKDLLVLHWLNGGVVVVLMDFLVQGCLDPVLLLPGHGLPCHSGRNVLVDGSIMVSSHESVVTCKLALVLHIPILGSEFPHGVFSGLHFGCRLVVWVLFEYGMRDEVEVVGL